MAWIGGLILRRRHRDLSVAAGRSRTSSIESLWAIKTPVLLLPGENDSGTPPGKSEAIRERVPVPG